MTTSIIISHPVRIYNLNSFVNDIIKCLYLPVNPDPTSTCIDLCSPNVKPISKRNQEHGNHTYHWCSKNKDPRTPGFILCLYGRPTPKNTQLRQIRHHMSSMVLFGFYIIIEETFRPYIKSSKRLNIDPTKWVLSVFSYTYRKKGVRHHSIS